ncbi:hypothetical protein NDA13_001063 [Ustilago tritici]|nr:hypothetical protein NDA13_001063 [Ustilago tritici]
MILHTPGQVDVEEWIKHPNVTAVVLAYLPGQEGGASLPPMLWGETNPSGKLLFTIGKKDSDYPPNTIVDTSVKNPTRKKDETSIQRTNEKLLNSDAGLYDTILTLETEITNSGYRNGSEVVQLYVGFPASADSKDNPQPIKTLRGFEKVKDLQPGETRKVSFELRAKDVAVWSTLGQGWKIPQGGELTFSVGTSSRKIHSKATWVYQD